MSRNTIYKDSRLTVVTGTDRSLGKFLQIFDNDLINETPEGEGLVLDWSQLFGFEVNLTGVPSSTTLIEIVHQYIKEHGDENSIIDFILS